MTRKVWKSQFYSCFTGHIRQTDEPPAELFRGSWMQGASALLWRVPILIWALVVSIWSASSFWGPTEKFLLYMTHWGLLFIVIESIFGIVVAAKKTEEFKPDATFGLPWYVKTYWVLYNITIPVAFLITVFYWCVLRASAKNINYAPNPILDIMLHGVNSLAMLLELVCSSHPSRLLHVMQPLWFSGAYLLFSVVYFLAGGLDPWGNPFIYPVVDWSKPDKTIIVVTLTALFLAMMHLLTVGIATLRDLVARSCGFNSKGILNDGFVA